MIIVMGVPGAGKSTVLDVAVSSGWKVINYGTMMFDIAKNLYKITDRDQLRKLDANQQKLIQAKVGEELRNIKEREVILDTHCSVNTPKGYLPGLPFSIISNILVERLVLVTAPIEHIIARRNSDDSRTRDVQSYMSLMEHDQMNHYYLAVYSVLCGAPAVIIENANGKLEQTRLQFAKLLE